MFLVLHSMEVHWTTYTFSTLYLLLYHLITVDALRTGFSRICTFLLHHFRFHVSYWQLLSSTAGSSLFWGFSVLCPCWFRSVKCTFLKTFNQLKWWKKGSDCGLRSSGMWPYGTGYLVPIFCDLLVSASRKLPTFLIFGHYTFLKNQEPIISHVSPHVRWTNTTLRCYENQELEEIQYVSL